MKVVRTLPNGVKCNYCGASQARPHNNTFGMCSTCYGEFDMWVVGESIEQDEQAAIFFSARKLALTAKRIIQGKISGRCECITTNCYGFTDDGQGYQCGSLAAHIVNGKKICGSHFRQPSPFWVSEPSDPYSRYGDILLNFCKTDEKFKSQIIRICHLI